MSERIERMRKKQGQIHVSAAPAAPIAPGIPARQPAPARQPKPPASTKQDYSRKKNNKPPAPARKGQPALPVPPRLPDGSRFDVKYDATSCTWQGILVVPVDGNVQYFRGRSRAVFSLLRTLDQQYRKWLLGRAAQ